jgi:glycosyltransferase involved in cell wall biosynthesis
MKGMISVVIPVYNAASRVSRAVESSLELDGVEEIILIEDGSHDDSLDVCRQLATHPKVQLYSHPGGRNLGAGATRNLGVSRARGEFIAFLDADDAYLPNRFTVDLSLLTSNPRIDGVYGATANEYESEEVRRLWLSQGRPHVVSLTERVEPEELIYALFGEHPSAAGEFTTDAVTVRRDTFLRVGGFHTELRLQQDTHLWARLAASSRLLAGEIRTPVAIRTVHAQNRMTNLVEHERYFDLWWDSLGDYLYETGTSRPVLQAWRKAHARFRASRHEKVKALSALTSWLVRQPSSIAEEYAHFDMTLLETFERKPWIVRTLSAKNRIVTSFRAR